MAPYEKKPKELLVDFERGIMEWDLIGGFGLALSDYQKELIRNGGSVGVMLKLAAELQAEGKI